MADPQPLSEIRIDEDNLYREESFTDLKVGSIQRLTPVKSDGSDDPSRPLIFVAHTQLMSNMGPLPVQARIEADSLSAAIEQFPQAMQQAVDRLIEEAREAQRQEMSRIVVPGERGAPKIQLP